MDWLLHREVSFDYLLTGLITSLIVASLICAMIIYFLGQLARLSDDNAELSTIISALPVPLALFDDQGEIQLLNAEFINSFGYTRVDIPLAGAWQTLAFPDPEYRAWVGEQWRRHLARLDDALPPLEIKVRCKNQSVKQVLATVRLLREAGRPLYLVLLYDISERVEAMNALSESRAILQSVIETIPMRVFWKDRTLRYLGCNSQFAQDGGAKQAEDVIGKTDLQLSWREQAQFYQADDRWVMQSGQAKLAYEEPQTTPDGRKILLRTSKVPLKTTNGETIGVLGVYDDITALKEIESQLWLTKTMIEKCKTAFFSINPDGQISYANDYACRSLGYSRDELIGMYPWDFDPDFPSSAWPNVWKRLCRNEIVNHQSSHRRKDGTVFPVDLTCHYINHNGLELSFTFVQNITERKRAETELRIAATAFESQEGMVITNADTVILKINKSFTNITGYSAEEAVGRKMNLLKSGIHDAEFFVQLWESVNSNGVWQGEIWNRRKNGEVFPEWLTITAVKGQDGRVSHYVGAMMDITARKAIEDHVHHLAHHDALTDLPNRTLLVDRLHQAIAQARREQAMLALMYLDLDKFKPINDGFGHDVGDLLLKEVAVRLRSCVKRESDTVSRLGGDEFVVVLSQIEHWRDGANVAEMILEVLSQPFEIEQHRMEISSSVGIAVYPAHGTDVGTLMKNADSAMYQAKCAGRGCFRFYGLGEMLPDRHGTTDQS